MDVRELLAYLAEELGAGNGSPSTAAMIRRLGQHLAGTAAAAADLARGGRGPPDRGRLDFEVLRTLQNFATLGPPDLMLLLVGGPELLP